MYWIERRKNAKATRRVDQEILGGNRDEKDAEKYLLHIEQQLSSSTLDDFKSVVSNRSFKISNGANEGLFQYWLDT